MPSALRHTPYFELLEALGQPGCALCRLAARAVARYLDSLSYENVNDVDLRATIREAIGLCNHHAWQFVTETRELLGTAIIYRDLIRTLQRRTGERSLQAALAPRGGCVACAARQTAIQDFAELLATSWSDAEVRQRFASSEGLCWNHLAAALGAGRFAAQRRGLIEAQRAAWERRLSRARREGQPALLLEALASAPGMTGVRLPSEAAEFPASEPPDLAEALPEVGPGHCPVCAAIVDRLTRARGVYAAGSACSVHAWLPALQPSAADLELLATRLGELDRRLADRLASDRDGPALLGWTWRFRHRRARLPEAVADLGCLVCREQSGFERTAIERAGPATLCVPHLRRVAPDQPDLEATLIRTRRAWHDLELELAEYIRKHDYRFRGEPIGDERDAPARAIALVAGLTGVR